MHVYTRTYHQYMQVYIRMYLQYVHFDLSKVSISCTSAYAAVCWVALSLASLEQDHDKAKELCAADTL